MDADATQILIYLKPIKEFVSPKVISRHVGGKKRFAREPNWAKPCLLRLLHEGLIESNADGHFRYKPPKEKAKMRKMALSPQILEILKASGKDFGGTIAIDEVAEG